MVTTFVYKFYLICITSFIHLLDNQMMVKKEDGLEIYIVPQDRSAPHTPPKKKKKIKNKKKKKKK